ncbi:MAG: VTT domain-containing protein [Firmicutes bacterium]|nr:TVP38/TMEM64 family protein [Alicyclobacillaceae bacterium]MCL6496053.1 VTT domain-containing protein [Bacillota bacterium]
MKDVKEPIEPEVEPVALEDRHPRLWVRILLWLAVALVLTALMWGMSHVDTLSGPWGLRLFRWKQHIVALGWRGPLVLMALLCLHSILLFLPVELPMLIAFGVYGPVRGALYSWIGSLAAAIAAYWLARGLGRPLVGRWVPPETLAKLDQGIRTFGDTGLLLLRFIPVVSFTALNYAAGLAGVNWWSFAWTSALGILASDSLIGLLYAGALNAVWTTAVGVAALTVASAWTLWRLERRPRRDLNRPL